MIFHCLKLFKLIYTLDFKQILYGDENSAFFPGLTWGGMSADTAIFVQVFFVLLLLVWLMI